MSRRRAVLLVLLLASFLAAACDQGGGNEPSPSLPKTATLAVTNGLSRSELTVEIAGTPEERSRGLMFRDELAEDAGMLFVFEEDSEAGFWMLDTTIPLSIAFITADGTILDLQDMQPLMEERTRPPGPYRYALEVNQGWFWRNGYAVGDRVEGLEGLGGQ
jgi:uncharacterized membrane protein (UPF0127 family)